MAEQKSMQRIPAHEVNYENMGRWSYVSWEYMGGEYGKEPLVYYDEAEDIIEGKDAEITRLRSIEAAARALCDWYNGDTSYEEWSAGLFDRVKTLEAALGQGQAGERGGSEQGDI